jgi:integration host factor subunit alpha
MLPSSRASAQHPEAGDRAALSGKVWNNAAPGKEMVDAFFEEIRATLECGEAVKLSGFGSFHVLDKPQRPGRNPKTGEAVSISARRVSTFHPSTKLKSAVENQRRSGPSPDTR